MVALEMQLAVMMVKVLVAVLLVFVVVAASARVLLTVGSGCIGIHGGGVSSGGGGSNGVGSCGGGTATQLRRQWLLFV